MIHRALSTLRLLLPALALASLETRSLLVGRFTTLASTTRFLALVLDTHLLVFSGLGSHGDIVVPLLDGRSLALLEVLLPLDPAP